MKIENYELPDKAAGKEELVAKERIGAGDKLWDLEVRYSEANDEYHWTVSNPSQEWNGYEATLELAVDIALQVYRDYMEEAD